MFARDVSGGDQSDYQPDNRPFYAQMRVRELEESLGLRTKAPDIDLGLNFADHKRGGDIGDPFAEPKKKNRVAEAIRAARIAEVKAGIPAASLMRWAEAQLWDNEPTAKPGYVRYVVKIRVCDRDPLGHANRKRENYTEATVMFATLRQFRKKLVERFGPKYVRATDSEIMTLGRVMDIYEDANGKPEAMIGWLIAKGVSGLGTLKFEDVFATLDWVETDGVMAPRIHLSTHDGAVDIQCKSVSQSSDKAPAYYGSWYCDQDTKRFRWATA